MKPWVVDMHDNGVAFIWQEIGGCPATITDGLTLPQAKRIAHAHNECSSKVVASERERCAKVADEAYRKGHVGAFQIAKRIREG